MKSRVKQCYSGSKPVQEQEEKETKPGEKKESETWLQSHFCLSLNPAVRAPGITQFFNASPSIRRWCIPNFSHLRVFFNHASYEKNGGPVRPSPTPQWRNNARQARLLCIIEWINNAPRYSLSTLFLNFKHSPQSKPPWNIIPATQAEHDGKAREVTRAVRTQAHLNTFRVRLFIVGWITWIAYEPVHLAGVAMDTGTHSLSVTSLLESGEFQR